MREPGENEVKAWAREYNESPFILEQKIDVGYRLVAWSEDLVLTKKAFYRISDTFPQTVEELPRIEFRENPESKPLWARYYGIVDRWRVFDVAQKNEIYVFPDGAHQLCIKEPEKDWHSAFDERGIFFLYLPTPEDADAFRSLGFEARHAEPIHSKPHFLHVPPDSEKLEMKFSEELQLTKANSDLD
jgi:hypothetical protein